MRAGVCSLKIEGRMKSAHYVATVVSVYRRAIDACFADSEHYSVPAEWLEELNKVSHRQYTTGFAVQKPDREAQVYTSSQNEQTHDFVGIALSYEPSTKRVYFEQRNNVKAGEQLELLMPNGQLAPLVLEDMLDEEGCAIECAPHAQQKFSAHSEVEILPFSLLRRKVVKK
jgi:putative protease